MRLESIVHRNMGSDCYAFSEDEVIIKLRTGKDITAVNVIHNDPFAAGSASDSPWEGIPEEMTCEKELKYNNLWYIRLKPKYKREQYYFEIFCENEVMYLFADDFYTKEQLNRRGRMQQYFKFPWINASDVCTPPAWVADTVWYQIMPDRFCRGDQREKSKPLKVWADDNQLTYRDFYGGDLRGIINQLEYLQELGITGIYFTPIFASDTNHKYNTTDYTRIDPDFGTEEDLKELVERAHSLGIHIMLDAVFNHSGTGFFAWQDVLEKGEKSEYFDWFFINQMPVDTGVWDTKDGRFYSFAFTSGMPKLNTNNPKVAEYFTNLCSHWVTDWKIDGIRFDVGDEVAHSFLKKLNRELKSIQPDLYLLGEIWIDSMPWLMGDEYDSVMNYPFIESLNNFWLDEQMGAKELSYAMNRCYSLYFEQTNRVLFNFLDSHDVGRVFTRCGENLDTFFQQLTMLLTMEGSPCIYYGTEIAMPGANDPFNRRCMPWEKMKAGEYEHITGEVKHLIALRKQYAALRGSGLKWVQEENASRLVHYQRWAEDGNVVEVYLNAGEQKFFIKNAGEELYSRNYENGCLAPGGVMVCVGRQ